MIQIRKQTHSCNLKTDTGGLSTTYQFLINPANPP